MKIRVRYAPSPTGNQHIGGVRTALFNYFFARATGGKFILRIEDTDQLRYKSDALQDIYDTFQWLNLSWDEGPDRGGDFGPYSQSERKAIYAKYAQQLIAEGKAYYCYCTSERLTKMREEQNRLKSGSGYDRKCRELSASEKEKLAAENPNPVVRLKIPLKGATIFHDELLGDIERKNEDINPDPVLLKSDGFPTYHLANVVDDHLMEISHIMRSQEWIPSVPIHIHLYKAFGWTPPLFVHLPMVKGEDGQKLSKRHGDTSLMEFRLKGYLPEAILNYISLLGWAFDDSREFFSCTELEELFTLEKLNKASAIFDYKKLDWFNGMYIRKKSDEALLALLVPFFEKENLISTPVNPESEALLKGIIPLIKERMRVLADATGQVTFFFQDVRIENPADLLPKKTDKQKTLEILAALKDVLTHFEERSDEENEELFRTRAIELGVKLGNFLMPLRVALTGTKVSPPLFESIRLLGSQKSSLRVENAIKILEN